MDVLIKQEVLSDEENLEDDPCHGPIEILEYEQRILLDTMDDDVIFVHARGLGMERLFLNHLIMYSDQKLLTIVLNTSQHDESYFISQLKAANVPCLPKLVNADVSTKDREAVYLEGGVQFLTSRILLVDLLTDRVPVKNIAGILVYRAHQVLSSFQESFILRLYRERKPGGYVKAFTDLPNSISALGQLQRVVDRLYIKRVRLIPRFDADVKMTLEKCPPAMTELIVDLPAVFRRVHTTFVELLKVCTRELKQCSTIEKQATLEEDTINVAVYRPSLLERHLNERRRYGPGYCSQSNQRYQERQRGIERTGDVAFEKSGGWMMSRVAGTLIADIETLCGYGVFKNRPFVPPPKWQVLTSVLDEIKSIPVRPSEIGPDGSVARQLTDLIKNGPEFLSWLTRRTLGSGAGKEPQKSPLWDVDNISEPRKEMVSDLQKNTLVAARAAKRRRKAAEDLVGGSDHGGRQTKIVQFGILQYKKRKSDPQVSTFLVFTYFCRLFVKH
ncbi:hypothetical protein ANCDUO_23277 [Ancylostoma duodenale]|uniref:DNA repair endonuclease XPF n=1 Tax=Ancylostoma duodenale TaxID=51022 RepID=A0A0C2BS39_9BILA|nr:hypothetical protein ANCDUO_23277 [Ancylostoma duodenale]